MGDAMLPRRIYTRTAPMGGPRNGSAMVREVACPALLPRYLIVRWCRKFRGHLLRNVSDASCRFCELIALLFHSPGVVVKQSIHTPPVEPLYRSPPRPQCRRFHYSPCLQCSRPLSCSAWHLHLLRSWLSPYQCYFPATPLAGSKEAARGRSPTTILAVCSASRPVVSSGQVIMSPVPTLISGTYYPYVATDPSAVAFFCVHKSTRPNIMATSGSSQLCKPCFS